ncbi:UBX domain-containing protein 6-like [Tubulanus polymorphus]|uniref:UBX domain-containing protein 6-like n=1 Tax=Tubulanus polymorphus TaxID=672921 RepID=UPI003DA56DCF
MSAIKKFFEKKKMELKFKKLGTGHRLNEESSGSNSIGATGSSSARPTSPRRAPISSEAQKAAEAAMARLNKPTTRKPVNSLDAEKQAMRRQIEAERAAHNKTAEYFTGPREVCKDHADVLAGVFFKCPMVGPDVLPKSEMEAKINEFLLMQLSEEPEMASAMMIHTLNKDKDKVKSCVDIICKYLDNLIDNEGGEKYCKIRVGNRVFQEKVIALEGVDEFMQSVGFTRRMIPNPETEEEFYVISAELAVDVERLSTIKDVLLAAEPLRPELDRGLLVFRCGGATAAVAQIERVRLPDAFYAISADELKREQQLRADAVEKLGMLRTKAMRERDEQRELRRYRYTLIRIRFPDSFAIQGTFRANEKASAVFEFARENLENSWMPFVLTVSSGQRIDDSDSSTLAELGLVPAVVLNFSFDSTIQAEVASQRGAAADAIEYLRSDLISLAQNL